MSVHERTDKRAAGIHTRRTVPQQHNADHCHTGGMPGAHGRRPAQKGRAGEVRGAPLHEPRQGGW